MLFDVYYININFYIEKFNLFYTRDFISDWEM